LVAVLGWDEPAWTLLTFDGRCDEDSRDERFEFGARCKTRLPSNHERMVIKLYGFCTDRPQMFSRRSCVSCRVLKVESLKKVYISRGINGAAGQD
jgi:hypothetical protein